ncbi:glucose-6-phosphate isomerase family protein [Goodfellowiella coeruleoviolacea]|uniref:glucose-6-phosphate isomerase n=1 Tax=Goodfellowiella coeruleoviolacea TaxID=334858 RepID=A0AAE3GAI5_9PSEU|nr:glucose-6-phosphate isomerase family protein [Goodfellowiella coeruleoviolacea]MCP2163869.1 glucose-6-phosphate isomerase [Goodfellowiella coeruleoviolacea]
MPPFATPPISPLSITFDGQTGTMSPEGPVLTRRMSDLAGLFADTAAWEAAVADGDPVVYQVASSPVPEAEGELPQSITTILPGTVAGEFHMTKGHQHPNPQGEIYLGLSGTGGLLLFDGERPQWIDMAPGVIGYIPPGWAHRSVNTGDEPYRFLAVYPGNAGHDYGWVLANGMGHRVYRGEGATPRFEPFTATP